MGSEWIYEVKRDGYRGIAVKDGKHVSLISRHGKNLTGDYPDVVAALSPPRVTIDGEDRGVKC